MIKTIEDARATGYGTPAFRAQYNEGFCIESVMKGYRSKQCTRKIWKGNFCKQHHPETVKAKNEKRERRWKFKVKNNPFTVLAGERDSYKSQLEGLNNDRLEMIALAGHAISLVDGAKGIVELWEAKTPAQITWKKEWIEQAKKIMEGK